MHPSRNGCIVTKKDDDRVDKFQLWQNGRDHYVVQTVTMRKLKELEEDISHGSSATLEFAIISGYPPFMPRSDEQRNDKTFIFQVKNSDLEPLEKILDKAMEKEVWKDTWGIFARTVKALPYRAPPLHREGYIKLSGRSCGTSNMRGAGAYERTQEPRHHPQDPTIT